MRAVWRASHRVCDVFVEAWKEPEAVFTRQVRAARERELALMGAALNLASDASAAAVAYPFNTREYIARELIANEADALWQESDRGGLTVTALAEAESRVGALRERLAAWEGK